jgi:hydroxymethylpyrimidine kinase/phosphomethylpyrimidine kinase
MENVICALTIAGSDSGGGAGIQADLKTFAALGVHGMAAITAITAQNTVAVRAVQDIDPDMVKAQIDAVAEDIGVDAVKTGMLHTHEIIKAVAEQIEKYDFPTVVDPVMVAKSGARLLKKDAAQTLIHTLFPLATVVTPNAIEAEVLSGVNIRGIDDAKDAAKAIARLGPQAVVVKGGHLFGTKAIDILYYEDAFRFFEAERLETKTTHGTGCSFSSAIAAELAKGTSIVEAIGVAKAFITRGIKFGLPIGQGHGPVNPLATLYNDANKYYTITQVQDAVDVLEAHPEVSTLIPESQTNIVMALPYALSVLDVAGVPGRVVRVGTRLQASSCPAFGASSHMARTILAVMKYDRSIRAGMNIRYSEKILDICTKLGLVISSYDRRKEPLAVKRVEGMTTPWGAEQAIKKIERVPQVLFHTGDWGKEPMIILLAKTSTEVADLAVQIAGEHQRRRSGPEEK